MKIALLAILRVSSTVVHVDGVTLPSMDRLGVLLRRRETLLELLKDDVLGATFLPEPCHYFAFFSGNSVAKIPPAP
jgi:hypothetical protein